MPRSLDYAPALRVLRCKGGPGHFALVKMIMHRVAHKLGYDLTLVELNMCPICLRRFDNFMGLSAHLHRGPCASQLEAIKDRAVEAYYRYRKMIVYRRGYLRGRGFTHYVVELDLPDKKVLIKTKNITEAIELLMGVIPP